MNVLTPVHAIESEVAAAHRRAVALARGGVPRDLSWRREQLGALLRMLKIEEATFYKALAEDLGRSEAETWGSELTTVIGEAEHARLHLTGWARPERVRTPLKLLPSRSFIQYESKGAVLVLGAWNLPLTVSLSPVVAALAAGNAIVLKPSELAPASARAMAELLPRYLSDNAVQVVEGDAGVAEDLLDRDWDHIFFTGSTQVGRKVATAAAARLTPVTLELGGKCPAYVDRSADLKVAARRIAWAKWMNAGQVCISPDYVLVDEMVADAFVAELTGAVRRFYGERPAGSRDFARIVNLAHFDRLSNLADETRGRVLLDSGRDRATLYFGPMIVDASEPEDVLLQHEIFGPILPVVRVVGAGEALARIDALPSPLAAYPFARDAAVGRLFEREAKAGAVVVNDAIVNHAVRGLPFGGRGASGHGVYHGVHGFRTFSHMKAVMRRPTWPDPSLRYPPFDAAKLRLLKRLG